MTVSQFVDNGSISIDVQLVDLLRSHHVSITPHKDGLVELSVADQGSLAVDPTTSEGAGMVFDAKTHGFDESVVLGLLTSPHAPLHLLESALGLEQESNAHLPPTLRDQKR